MTDNGSNESQTITPMIAYEDGAAAIDWLVRAFGFREVMRMTEEDGRISHAELELGGGVIMLASPTPDNQSPRRHREQCEPVRKWSALPMDHRRRHRVRECDADSHHQQARKAGARILSEPDDQPARTYLSRGRH